MCYKNTFGRRGLISVYCTLLLIEMVFLCKLLHGYFGRLMMPTNVDWFHVDVTETQNSKSFRGNALSLLSLSEAIYLLISSSLKTFQLILLPASLFSICLYTSFNFTWMLLPVSHVVEPILSQDGRLQFQIKIDRVWAKQFSLSLLYLNFQSKVYHDERYILMAASIKFRSRTRS